MHAPEQRCAALAQVRQINYCFVCKKLIFSIYGSLPGQLLLLKSTRKAPVLCPFGWFLLSSRHDFGGSVWVSLTSDAEGMQGTFFWWLAEASSLPLPLEEEVLLRRSMELRPPWLFLKVLCVPSTSIKVSRSFPFPPLLSHVLASPASRSMPAYSYPKVPAVMPDQPKSSCFHFSRVSCG